MDINNTLLLRIGGRTKNDTTLQRNGGRSQFRRRPLSHIGKAKCTKNDIVLKRSCGLNNSVGFLEPQIYEQKQNPSAAELGGRQIPEATVGPHRRGET